MSSEMTWRIYVKNLETCISVGIYDHERKPQRIVVNATVEAHSPANPKSINDCFTYEHIHALVTQEWPKRPHVALLETYAVELLEHIFRSDARVTRASVSLCKPDVYADAEAAGVGAEWTRADFKRLALHGEE